MPLKKYKGLSERELEILKYVITHEKDATDVKACESRLEVVYKHDVRRTPERELDDALKMLHPTETRVKEILSKAIAEERGRRKKIRDDVAAFDEALQKTLRSKEDIEAYLKKDPDFWLRKDIEDYMACNGSYTVFKPFSSDPLKPSYLDLCGVDVTEIPARIMRVCKDAMLDTYVMRSARDVGMLYAFLETAWDDDAIEFCARLKAAFAVSCELSFVLDGFAKTARLVSELRRRMRQDDADLIYEGVLFGVLMPGALKHPPESVLKYAIEHTFGDDALEELLPSFLDKVPRSSLYWSVDTVKKLRGTRWSTVAMRAAVDKFVPHTRIVLSVTEVLDL
jgi:hypothetical protein